MPGGHLSHATAFNPSPVRVPVHPERLSCILADPGGFHQDHHLHWENGPEKDFTMGASTWLKPMKMSTGIKKTSQRTHDLPCDLVMLMIPADAQGRRKSGWETQDQSPRNCGTKRPVKLNIDLH